MFMIVYKVTNRINEKVYVGITTHSLKRRKWQHLSIKYSGTAILSKAIVKYGKENFIFEQIDNADSEIELIAKEKYWIEKLNTVRPNGYNVLSGKLAGKELAKSREVKIICLETGKTFNTLSDATREYGLKGNSIWCACSGRTDFAGNVSFRYIEKEKYEIAEKRRNNRKEKAKTGYRIGWDKTKKPVKCIETGEVFDSGKTAGKLLNINPSQITRVCKGKNNTAGGYRFIYV